ncbi:hypothetical protein BaRGS_00038419 [Batillaria attramentaria]|uniref:CUB domain-containing protein n=1 Tax=Batillaria attramentaria TaxID=370345 RepID=A0ABD0J5U1_9CAEN
MPLPGAFGATSLCVCSGCLHSYQHHPYCVYAAYIVTSTTRTACFPYHEVIVMAVLMAASAEEHLCHRDVTLTEGEELDMTLEFVNMTSLPYLTSSVQCVVELRTPPGQRLVLDITYIRHPSLDRNDCDVDFLLVGNDFTSVGEELTTSYKFCDVTLNTEIVSRDNYLWVVIRYSLIPTNFRLRVKSQAEAICGPDDVPCSPVQCVSRDRLCDGTPDCSNGADEYCYRPDLKLTAVSEKTASCFQCGDGTCILPQQARYGNNWGVPLWFLCDHHPHCPDAWDERTDICYRIKGRMDAVIECVPSDVPFGANTSVRMWFTARCDGKADCRNGEDETNCPSSETTKRLKWEPLRALMVAMFATVVCGVAALAFRCERSKRGRQVGTAINTPPAGCGRKLQSCLATRYREDCLPAGGAGTAKEASVTVTSETGELRQTRERKWNEPRIPPLSVISDRNLKLNSSHVFRFELLINALVSTNRMSANIPDWHSLFKQQKRHKRWTEMRKLRNPVTTG